MASTYTEEPSFTPGENLWDLVESSLTLADRVLLSGPPGTGKTWASRHMGLPKGAEWFAVTLQEEQPVSDLRGSFMPDGPGKFKWSDGPAVAAWRGGSRLIIDEIDHADPAVWSLLHAICDDPDIAGFRLPNGEHIRPADGFEVVATMNGDPEDLPSALADRFAVKILVDTPHPAAIAGLPEDLRRVAAELCAAPPNRRVSLRSWLAFAKLRGEGMSEERAAYLTLGATYVTLLDSIRTGRLAK